MERIVERYENGTGLIYDEGHYYVRQLTEAELSEGGRGSSGTKGPGTGEGGGGQDGVSTKIVQGDEYQKFPTLDAVNTEIRDMGYKDENEFEKETGASTRSLVGKFWCLVGGRVYVDDGKTSGGVKESLIDKVKDELKLSEED